MLRASLLPGIWKNINENSKHADAFRLFEIGREIHKQEAGLPHEIEHLAAAIYSRNGDGVAALFEVKRLAQCLLPGAEARPAEARPYEHPARSAEVLWQGRQLGRIFEFHPSMVEEGRAAVLDLDLSLIYSLGPGARRYIPIRRYPSSAFDLSVIAGERDLVGDLRERLSDFASDMLESIEYIRQYSGPPLAQGQKSVSFRLTLGSSVRTLSSEEVSQLRTRIIDGMRGLGYELRV